MFTKDKSTDLYQQFCKFFIALFGVLRLYSLTVVISAYRFYNLDKCLDN